MQLVSFSRAQELAEEAYGQDERLNCLVEATIYAAELAQCCEYHGRGPVAVRRLQPYFCKSTDAYAACYPTDVWNVADHVEAVELLNREQAKDPDAYFEIWPPVPPANPVPVAAADDDDECPF